MYSVAKSLFLSPLESAATTALCPGATRRALRKRRPVARTPKYPGHSPGLVSFCRETREARPGEALSVHHRFGSPRPSGERGLGVRGQARFMNSGTVREVPCQMRHVRHTLSQPENPPHPRPLSPLGRGEPKLSRGPSESHTPQDFPSFATKTS